MMLEQIGFWTSNVAGLVLLVMAMLGVRGFLPRYRRSQIQSSRILALAVSLGFIWAGLNALYWQVFGQTAIALGWLAVKDVRLYGSFLDVILKGGAAYAVYLHFKAWHASLPESEQSQWSVLGMAFYPNPTGFIARVLNGFRESRKG